MSESVSGVDVILAGLEERARREPHRGCVSLLDAEAAVHATAAATPDTRSKIHGTGNVPAPDRWLALDRRSGRVAGLPTVEVVAAEDYDREVNDLRDQVQMYEEKAERDWRDFGEMQDARIAADDRVVALTRALEFYADANNYVGGEVGWWGKRIGGDPLWCMDFGVIARNALAGVSAEATGVWPDQSAQHAVLLEQIKDAYAEGKADAVALIRERAALALPDLARFTLDEVEAIVGVSAEATPERGGVGAIDDGPVGQERSGESVVAPPPNPYRTLHARMSPPGAAWDEGFAAGLAARETPDGER